MSKISDELRDYGRRLVSNASPFNCTFGDIRAYQDELADRIDAETVELPKDKDGVPIHVGDTVYGEDGRAWHVEGISLGRWAKWVEGHVVHAMGDSGQWRDLMPEWLTHERPDSFERIADELEAWCDRADVDGDACEEPRELARRIRKLAEREASDE
jgi:hypothetical protein